MIAAVLTCLLEHYIFNDFLFLVSLRNKYPLKKDMIISALSKGSIINWIDTFLSSDIGYKAYYEELLPPWPRLWEQNLHLSQIRLCSNQHPKIVW